MTYERFCKNKNIIYEEYDDSCIIWNSQKGEYHILNKSAMQIFVLCDQCTKEDVILKMYNLYKEELAIHDLSNDVETVINDLINKDLVCTEIYNQPN